MGRMHLFSTGRAVGRAPATRTRAFHYSGYLLVREACKLRGFSIRVTRNFREDAGCDVFAIVIFSFWHRCCSRSHSRMGVEGSDVDGVPKEVGGVGRPRSGPIRIIAPRRIYIAVAARCKIHFGSSDNVSIPVPTYLTTARPRISQRLRRWPRTPTLQVTPRSSWPSFLL
jgi:hypothetical protein